MSTTMPESITLPNGSTLSKLDTFNPVEPTDFALKALCYTAMSLFCDLDTGGDLDMDAIDQASSFQCGELYLNNYEGYDDESEIYYAKTLAIDGDNAIAVHVWDYYDHSAWYAVRD